MRAPVQLAVLNQRAADAGAKDNDRRRPATLPAAHTLFPYTKTAQRDKHIRRAGPFGRNNGLSTIMPLIVNCRSDFFGLPGIKMEANCNQQKTCGQSCCGDMVWLIGRRRMPTDGTWAIRGCTTRRFGRLSGGKKDADMGGNTAVLRTILPPGNEVDFSRIETDIAAF